MKTAWKAMTKLMILGALAATPLFAQVIPYSLTFTTSFPFYVGNQYMPAGSYEVTQPEIDGGTLLMRDMNWRRAEFIGYIPTETLAPVNQGKVTFREYGKVAFLASFTVTGETSGALVPPDKREKTIASQVSQEQMSMNSVPLEPTRAGD
ncbi:MAG: hypothetical protein WBE76_29075 [Terracidiphilus sp.]